MNSIAPFATALLLTSAAIAQIAPGTLAVVRTGDGAFGLTNSAHHTFLDTYDRTTPGQSAPLQSQLLPLTIAGTSNHGFVTQSVDGRYLVVAGYGATPYTGLITFTTSVAFPRVIARIALDGTVDASTALTNAHSGGGGLPGDILGAVTVDGTVFWTSGGGVQTGNRGVCRATLGASTSIQITATHTSTRVPNIADGQLFVSSWFQPFVGVNTVGIGLPATSGQSTALLAGMPASDASHQPWDFWFADAVTLYVADSRTNGAGGIQKWTKTGSTWALQYTLAASPTVGCRAVTGIRDLGGTTLWATTTEISGNQLVAVVDTGAGATFTTLATAPTNTGFRGVRFVRTPPSAANVGAGCATSAGVPTIGVGGGQPVSGNGNLQIVVGNTPPVALFFTIVSIGTTLDPVGLPLSILGGPACAFLHPTTFDIVLGGVAFGAGAVPLGLPTPDAALWGLQLAVQHLVWDDVFYPGLGLPVGTSPGLQLVIGN